MQERGLPPRPVLGADTEVVLDDVIFGKPHDADAARAMLAKLSGRVHDVVSAVALRFHDDIEVAVSVSQVTFRKLTAGEIERYIETREPFDKAGGYAIQGRAAAFVTQTRRQLLGRHGTAAGGDRVAPRADRTLRAIRASNDINAPPMIAWESPAGRRIK